MLRARAPATFALLLAAAVSLLGQTAEAGLITPHLTFSYFNTTANWTASEPVSWELLSSNNGASNKCNLRAPSAPLRDSSLASPLFLLPPASS